MPASANLIPELLDLILREVESDPRSMDDTDDAEDDSSRSYCPPFILHPLLLVCKSWHAVAERRMYTIVSIGECGTQWEKPEIAASLASTLQTNTRVAGLVRRLRLRTPQPQSADVRATCQHYLQILTHCTNATSLRILGWDCSDAAVQLLKFSIGRLRRLQRISIDLDGYSANSVTLFGSCDQVLQYLFGWPDLTYLMVSLPCQDWDDADEFDQEPLEKQLKNSIASEGEPLGAPTLAEICVRVADQPTKLTEVYLYTPLSLGDIHLRTLTAMAPKLSGFACMATDTDLCTSRNAFRQAIRTWAPSLHNLAILTCPTQRRTKRSAADGPILDDTLCRQLTELKILTCTSETFASAATFEHLPSLTWLFYVPTRADHVDELVGILPKLQCLQTLCFASDWLYDENGALQADRLQAACTENGIRLDYD